MRREAPFATDPTTLGATVRRLEARRRRLEDHAVARSFGLPERHARKLRLLAERAKQAERSEQSADPPSKQAA